jgi:ATP-binding cassette subfamily C protein LapB
MNKNEHYIENDKLLDALVLFTKLYHKPYTHEELTYGLPIDKDDKYVELFSTKGSHGLFSRAAKRAGLKSKIIRRNLSNISPLLLPAIIVLKNRDACILEDISDDGTKMKIIMPEAGESETWVDVDKLSKQYIGFAFLLKKEYEYHNYKKVVSYSDPSSNTNDFWETIKISAKLYQHVILASLLINLFILATPLFTMSVYDRVVPNNATETLWTFTIGIVVVYMLDMILKFTRTYYLELAAKKSDIILSSIIYEKIMDLKMSVRPKSVGSFSENIKDFDSIRSFLTSATLTAVIDLPFIIIFLIVIGYIGGWIVLVPILSITVILTYSLIVRKPLQRSIEESHQMSAEKNALLVETLSSAETIKTMGINSYLQYKWEEIIGEVASKALKSRILSASIPSVTAFLSQMNTVFIVVVGVYMIKESTLTMGGLIAGVILGSRAIAPMGQLVALLANFEQTKVSYTTLREILGLPVDRPAEKEFVQREIIKGTIEFKNVSFTYPDEDKPAIENVTFTINSGESVGLIGKVGSGKTTIEKLILGIYEPTEGTILIDGIDLHQIDPATLRKNISYVPQDTVLFRGSVKENIIYKAPYVSDESIVEASELSCASEFINSHPKGYDMTIGERGASLSGGQRQSIAIARAFVVDSPIVLLDEPTSSMDNNTETKIKRNIKDKCKEKTTILITHRYSLLDMVDRLMVFDKGRLVLDDTRETVINKLSGK